MTLGPEENIGPLETGPPPKRMPPRNCAPRCGGRTAAAAKTVMASRRCISKV